jgi:hypothetical protein
MRALPLIACLLIGGVVADRTSRRRVLVSADLCASPARDRWPRS